MAIVVEVIEMPDNHFLIELSTHGEALGPFTMKELFALLRALESFLDEEK